MAEDAAPAPALPRAYALFNGYFIDLLKAVKSAPACKKAVRTWYREFDHASRAHLDDLAAGAAPLLAALERDGAAALDDAALRATPIARDIALADLLAARDQLSRHALEQTCFVLAILVRQAALPDAAVDAAWERLRANKGEGVDGDGDEGVGDEGVRRLAAGMLRTAAATRAEPDMPPGVAETLDKFKNTKIGKLAKSITDELHLDGEAELNPATIGSILGKVGSVMQKSMTDGDLSLTDMISEVASMASAIPSMVAGMGGAAGAGVPPQMGEMLKSLMGAFAVPPPQQQHRHRHHHGGAAARARLADKLLKQRAAPSAEGPGGA